MRLLVMAGPLVAAATVGAAERVVVADWSAQPVGAHGRAGRLPALSRCQARRRLSPEASARCRGLVRHLFDKQRIMTFEKILYTAKAHTTGGRDGGTSHSHDGRLDVKLSSPGGPGAGTNPAQLFAAGWSACFLSAIRLVAGKKKISAPG